MTQPFNPELFKPVDPFKLFMARVAGQPVKVTEAGHVLKGYLYKGQLYITALFPVT